MFFLLLVTIQVCIEYLILLSWLIDHFSILAPLLFSGSSIIFLLCSLCAETCLVNGWVLIFSLMMILMVCTPSPSSLLIHPGLKLSLRISANNFVFNLTWNKPYNRITNALWVSSNSFQNKATDVYIITAWRRSLTVIWEFRDWTHAVHLLSAFLLWFFLWQLPKLPSGKTSLALLSHISPMYWDLSHVLSWNKWRYFDSTKSPGPLLQFCCPPWPLSNQLLSSLHNPSGFPLCSAQPVSPFQAHLSEFMGCACYSLSECVRDFTLNTEKGGQLHRISDGRLINQY